MPIVQISSSQQIMPPQSAWRSIARSVIGWVSDASLAREQAYVRNHGISSISENFSLINPELIADREIYVVDHSYSLLVDCANTVAASAASVMRLDNLELAAEILLDKSPSEALLVINIDIGADLDDVVDDLLTLKQIMPDLPVVICSDSFTSNDFSSQRRAIADASLRLPCSHTALALAIEAGVSNSLRKARLA